MIPSIVQEIVSELVRLAKEAGTDIWQVTFGQLDPFWGYAFDGVLIIAACVAAAWFFNLLRPISGAIVAATILFLVGFWKGETAEQQRLRKKRPR